MNRPLQYESIYTNMKSCHRNEKGSDMSHDNDLLQMTAFNLMTDMAERANIATEIVVNRFKTDDAFAQQVIRDAKQQLDDLHAHFENERVA